MKLPLVVIASSMLVTVAFTGCETPGQTAMLGAATGALIGNQSYTGPLRGAAIGAGAGYLIGKIFQHNRERHGYVRRDRDYDDEDDYSYRRSRYPVASPTRRYGFVTSPYPPYHLIDVRGIPRGAKVIDPSSDRVFINP